MQNSKIAPWAKFIKIESKFYYKKLSFFYIKPQYPLEPGNFRNKLKYSPIAEIKT